MKTVIVFALLASFVTCRSQGFLEYECIPATPNEGEGIKIRFLVVTPWFGASKKSSNLVIQNDTIYYRACYTMGGNAQTESYIPDTVSLGLLAPKVYHVRAIGTFTLYPTDIACDSIHKRDTLDTLITVSALIGIHNPKQNDMDVIVINSSTIHLYAHHAGTATIQVLDAAGGQCHVAQKQVAEGNNELALDIPQLPSGLYIYHIQLGEQRKVLKYVKQ